MFLKGTSSAKCVVWLFKESRLSGPQRTGGVVNAFLLLPVLSLKWLKPEEAAINNVCGSSIRG